MAIAKLSTYACASSEVTMTVYEQRRVELVVGHHLQTARATSTTSTQSRLILDTLYSSCSPRIVQSATMKRTSSALAPPPKRHQPALERSTSSLALPPLTPPTRPPPFQQPQRVLTFSYDAVHILYFNDRSKRYYVDPPPGADLNHRYDKWVRRPDERGRLDALLRAIEHTKDRPQLASGAVCWRGVMTKSAFRLLYTKKNTA